MNTNTLKLYHRDQELLADNFQGEFIIYEFKVSWKKKQLEVGVRGLDLFSSLCHASVIHVTSTVSSSN